MARGFVGRKKAKKYKRFVFVDEQNKNHLQKQIVYICLKRNYAIIFILRRLHTLGILFCMCSPEAIAKKFSHSIKTVMAQTYAQR